MEAATARQYELTANLVRQVDRKMTFELRLRGDGDVELRLKLGQLQTMTQFKTEALDATADDVIRFRDLRLKIQRVYARMRTPGPVPKVRDNGPGIPPPRFGGGGFRR